MARATTFNGAQTTLYDDERAEMRVYALDKRGLINYNKIISKFSDVIVQELSETDTERTQVLLAEEPKLYVYGKQHKFIQITGVLPDARLDNPIQIGTSSWDGHGYTKWLNFYDNFAKLSVCARKNYRVVLVLERRMYIGGIVQMTASMNAEKPHEYQLSFIMYTPEVVTYVF